MKNKKNVGLLVFPVIWNKDYSRYQDISHAIFFEDVKEGYEYMEEMNDKNDGKIYHHWSNMMIEYKKSDFIQNNEQPKQKRRIFKFIEKENLLTCSDEELLGRVKGCPDGTEKKKCSFLSRCADCIRASVRNETIRTSPIAYEHGYEDGHSDCYSSVLEVIINIQFNLKVINNVLSNVIKNEEGEETNTIKFKNIEELAVYLKELNNLSLNYIEEKVISNDL